MRLRRCLHVAGEMIKLVGILCIGVLDVDYALSLMEDRPAPRHART